MSTILNIITEENVDPQKFMKFFWGLQDTFTFNSFSQLKNEHREVSNDRKNYIKDFGANIANIIKKW